MVLMWPGNGKALSISRPTMEMEACSGNGLKPSEIVGMRVSGGTVSLETIIICVFLETAIPR